MRMKVAAGLRVYQTNDIPIPNVCNGLFHVVQGLAPVGVEEPIVVGVFVVVASDLLLLGSFRVRLNVGMQ